MPALPDPDGCKISPASEEAIRFAKASQARGMRAILARATKAGNIRKEELASITDEALRLSVASL